MKRAFQAMSGLLMSRAKHGPSARLASLLLLLFAVHWEPVPRAHAASRITENYSSTIRIQEAGKGQITTLELGQAIDREIASEQRQKYQINLSAGQFASVTVKQQSIDVVVRLFGPDQKLIAEVDADSRPQGQEIVELVATTSGPYGIEVLPKYKSFPPGHYEIRLVEVRAASERDNSLDEARRLHAQARSEYQASNYDKAIRNEEKSLSIRERILGVSELEVAQSLFGLGLYYRNAGDIPRAEESYLRALAIREKALGPGHPDVSLVLHNLGYLYYYDLRDYARAESLYERSLAIKEKAFGPDHPLVASTLTNIGLLEWKKRDYARAEASFHRASEIFEKTSGRESDGVATAVHNLGIVYKESGDYTKGEAYYRQALQIWEKILGKDHPRVALALESLGILFRDKGDYESAEPFLQRALDIEVKGEGENHPDVANCLVIMARMFEAKGDTSRAIEYQSRAAAIEEKNIALNLSLGSERQKLRYFSSMMKEADRRISLHVRSAPDDPGARDLAFTMILQRKGRVLDALADTLAALRRRSTARDQALLDRLNDSTARLARLVLDGPENETTAEHDKRIESLEEQREQLEEEVGRRSAGLYQRSQEVTLEAVRDALPGDAALIEYAVYHPSDPKVSIENETTGEAHYVAYVIRSQGGVEWKELGPAKEIDARLDEWRRALRDPQRTDVQRLARVVDQLIVQPLRPLLGPSVHLIISPDGTLNLIPFAALADEQNRFLIERYAISYVTSGRDLLRFQVAHESRSPPVIVAAPAFGEPALITRKVGSIRTGSGARLDYSRPFFGPLPGAQEEMRALRVLLPEARLLTGDHATKAAVESLTAPPILHVATHGFFKASAAAASSESSAKSPTRAVGADGRIENPLLHSGLALAGANRGDESGILTALEASGLNLWGTRLVVLSACDTGVGEIKNGEGVYGLRRALVLAGAESQLMSLWPASDRSTRDLMIGYYKNLTNRVGRGDSLRKVQLEMLQNKTHRHPYYWASFIQTGEWATMEGKR